MSKEKFVGAVISYFVALIFNLFVILNWPDSNLSILNLLVSLVFIGFLAYVGYYDFIRVSYHRLKNVFFKKRL